MNSIKLVILSLFIFVLISCGEDENNITPPEVTSANIIGSVNLFDDRVTEIDNSGMTVTVEAISPSISATTDSEGNFTLENVPFGTYTLVYEKSGYGTFKYENVQHDNTGSSTIITNTPSLGQISTTAVTGLSAAAQGSDIRISVTTDPGGNIGNTRYIRFFYSENSSVSGENYTSYSDPIISQINPYQETLTQANLSEMGFSSGSTVYVKVYGESFFSNEYDDSNLGRRIFPNLNQNSATAVSFVVP